MSDLSDFRKEKDELFGTTKDSPLTAKQKKEFDGLKYFPDNEKYRIKAKLEKKESGEMIDVKTSAGDTEVYKRYGKLNFSIEGNKLTLNVYQSTGSNHLFLPFRDKTNDSETYHDGRYVEVEDTDKEVDLDFNYAYNPYCAYNDNFRCPITPNENTLDTEIKVGEKRYH